VAIRNVARGGGKALKPGVTGVKELEAKLRAMTPDNPGMLDDMSRLVVEAAAAVRDEMRTQAKAAGWDRVNIHQGGKVVTGAEAIDSIFSFAKPLKTGGRKPKISASAGVLKKLTMVEWTAGRNNKSPNAKVAPGNKVAMSLAAMLEFGTSRMAAKPAIRTAVKTARQRVIDILTRGYNDLLVKYSQ
jgi:hypothetical protein